MQWLNGSDYRLLGLGLVAIEDNRNFAVDISEYAEAQQAFQVNHSS